ncbi:aldehyde dehydrogenase [Pseudonocardia sulfidoxydans NBRC 16205]|uniref:Aldehyde dehydrogenase n=1 Tax=Pseudonocardia sulfidoxydans NBRC 16205 TaxID=1223511 RepID=A0A511DHA6_9PSEU|nr:aldehyde dehydrogenase family protein [Pseudonocardia sulfidoxydans]GEL23144.1 aldehyde dehydrogenase [Pseudonocardia sulfidoxydans NBRC 16205]
MTTVLSPIDGARIAEIDDLDAAAVDRALDNATAAQPAWARRTPQQRAEVLRRVGLLVHEHLDELAELESRNTGKLMADTRREAERAANCFLYYSGWPDKVYGRTYPVSDAFHVYSERTPFGVVAGVIPWNVPFLFAAKKFAPALAFGNAVLVKPAAETPLTALRLLELMREAGVPEGLADVLTGGADVGRALVGDPRTKLIVFTGHHDTGRAIARAAAQHLTPITLELGGKSPQLLFDDADVATAIDGIVMGIYASCGQMCIAGSRLLVQEPLYDAVVTELAARTSALTAGDPRAPGVDIGPQVTAVQRDKTLAMIETGRAEGATVRAQGSLTVEASGSGGFYVPPTLFVDVDPGMDIVRKEVFGPVLAVSPFRDEDDALAQAADTEFGLAAGVWTRDVGRAHRVARRLRAGTVWLNTYRVLSDIVPFGGVGLSGYGRENAEDAVHLYTYAKSVWTATDGGLPAGFARTG